MYSLIPGLSVKKGFISEKEESDLVSFIDSKTWSNALSRRTQHYGYIYNYKTKQADEKAEDIPEELEDLVKKTGITGDVQCIINEYMPGQGISKHIDDPIKFGDKIYSISLLSDISFRFISEHGAYIDVWVPRRSLITLEGDARYKWEHSIIPKKSDVYMGRRICRTRRISITLRLKK